MARSRKTPPASGTRLTPPPPIHLKALKQYISDKREGKNPILPETSDVFMFPGSSAGKDGWWLAEQFWMQCELALDIFEHVCEGVHACHYTACAILFSLHVY